MNKTLYIFFIFLISLSTLISIEGKEALFDFTIMLSPPSVTVEQGETANYQLQITYSDPSYYGTQINYQVIGLGPGLNWVPTGGGAIPISTSPTASPGTYPITVIASAQGKTHQTSATLIVTESSPTIVDEEETATTSIEPTSPTAIEPTTVTIIEQAATQTPTPTTEPPTDKEESDLTSQLLNPTTLMAIIIAILAIALITTLARARAICQECGFQNPRGIVFCGKCGCPLDRGKIGDEGLTDDEEVP